MTRRSVAEVESVSEGVANDRYFDRERLEQPSVAPSTRHQDMFYRRLIGEGVLQSRRFPWSLRAVRAEPGGDVKGKLMWKSIQLTSGRIVRLESLHLSQTYAGLLEGSPDATLNASIMSRATVRMDRVWGKRPAMVIEPKIEAFDFDDKRHPRLPACLYTAWLTSEPMDERFCGSELVVVWFGPWAFDATLGDLIQEAVKAVPWEANARNFDY